MSEMAQVLTRRARLLSEMMFLWAGGFAGELKRSSLSHMPNRIRQQAC